MVARLLDGLAEALGVLLHQSVHLLLRYVQGTDQLGVLAAECLAILGKMFADLIVLEIDAARVAGHARDAGLDRAIGPLGIADDGGGALVLPHVVGVDQHVGVQAVGQIENDFAGGVLKTNLAETGAERISEQIAAIGQQNVAFDQILRHGLEVVGPPVGAGLGVVAFQDAVIFGYSGAVESGTSDALLLNV